MSPRLARPRRARARWAAPRRAAAALLMAAGCTPLPSPKPGAPDSGAAPGGDTAAPITPPSGAPVTVEATPVRCEAPEARAALGPFMEWDRGPDWRRQTPLSLSPGADPRRGAGAIVDDLTGDGLLDVFLTAENACVLMVGQPDGALADESHLRLPALPGGCRGWGASAADVDADGDLDVLLARDGEPDQLLLNQGDGVLAVGEAAGLGALRCGSRSASWGDIDGDGDLDLFIGRHHVVAEGLGEARCAPPPLPVEPGWSIRPGDPNSLYLSNGDGTFVEVSDRLSPAARQAYTFLGGFLDLDEDGDQDLYLINDYGPLFEPNIALRNDGAGHFDDPGHPEAAAASPEAAAEHLRWASLRVRGDGMSLGVSDVDFDGLPDLVISDIDVLHLMLSGGGGGWYDAARARGLGPSGLRGQRAAWGTELADLNNDGLLDVVVVYGPTEGLLEAEGSGATEQPDAVFMQSADGSFVDRAPALGLDHRGVGRGLVVADLDGDGWLDLLRTDYRGGPALMHRQRCGEAAWLTVRLVGDPENPSAMGAKVSLRAEGRVHTRWSLGPSTSLASSGPPVLHFGLGGVERVSELVIRWPDGAESVIAGIDARQHLVVRRVAGR